MKIFSAAIVTTVLALGLAGNSMAAPGHNNDNRLKQYSSQNKHQSAKKPSKKVVVQKRVHKAPVKRIVRAVTKRAPNKKVSNRSYRVRPGDTLNRIAARNHVSLQKLIKLNNLWGKRANNLRVGMVIRLG